MNSARIRCSRRSSETSSRTSQIPDTGERRARTMTVAPELDLIVTSPLAEPLSIADLAIPSIRESTNASRAERPTIEPGRRSRSW